MNKRHTSLFGAMCAVMIFSGCSKQPVISIEQKQQPVLRPFEAHIEGIECALCAQDVVNMFKEVEGVHSASYVREGQEYEGGYVHFYYDLNKKNIKIAELDKALHDEGFELQSLAGSFFVKPMLHNGKQYVVFDEQMVLPLLMGHSLKTITSLAQHYNEIRFAQGQLVRQEGQDGFSFVMQQT